MDAGCFGGASTVAFCRGLKDSDRALTNNMIVAYDLFETDRLSQSIFGQYGIEASLDQSFLPIFMDIIRGHESLVSIVKGSILDFGWSGGSIDILFLDVLKSQELNDHCMLAFLPDLKEEGIIFHQDYIHDPLPWIPLTMAALDDHFEMFGWCKNTAVFRCVKSVDRNKISKVLEDLRHASFEKKKALFEKILDPFPAGVPNINLSLSRVWMMAYHGDLAAAKSALSEIPDSEEWVRGKILRLSATIDRMGSG